MALTLLAGCGIPLDETRQAPDGGRAPTDANFESTGGASDGTACPVCVKNTDGPDPGRYGCAETTQS